MTALAADPGAPVLRSELAQTWHQLAQVLDRHVNTYEQSNEAADEEDEDQDLADAGAEPAARLSPAEVDGMRLEEIELWDRAARVYAELGPDHLRDRFQSLNNAARALPEDDVPDWLLPSAERLLAQLNERE